MTSKDMNSEVVEALKKAREGLSIAAGWASRKPDSQNARDKIRAGLDGIRQALASLTEGGDETITEQLRRILSGIDKTETDSDDGWWETSTGAEFGARKLQEVLTAASPHTPEDAGTGEQ